MPTAAAMGGMPGSGLDLDLLAAVEADAIEFMLPRTLEPVTAGQLAEWALSGLTALDPALTVFVREGGKIDLVMQGRSLVTVAVAPKESSAPSWAAAIAKVVAAGYAASAPVRQAGQAGITKSLFDEMLGHLDPYSRYIPPIEAVGDRDRRIGRAGIGVTIVPGSRFGRVREVVIGSPAALAGIGPGDSVQFVNQQPARGRDHLTLEAMLGGPEGTELRVAWRDQDETPHVATMTRVMIPPETVFPRRMGDITVIQISGFTQTTDQHVAHVIRGVLRSRRPSTGLILDLRGNRGGVLRTAISTAESFLPGGVLVRASGRAPETNRVWVSGGRDTANGIRMAVLVDGGTASAAEVLAAALADRGRAVVVGSSTFGKGAVQTIEALPDGGELFLTWSRLLAPRGWPIQSLGVIPQICMSLGADAPRRQLASLAAGRLELEGAIRTHRAARAPMTPDQIVAIRGQCPASDPHDDDLRVAQTLLENPASYAAALLLAGGEER